MGELKNLVTDNQAIVERVKSVSRQVAMAGLGLVEVLKVEGEKLQAIDFNAKAEEFKAKALELKAKLQAVDVKAEAEKLQAIDFTAQAEVFKAKALEFKAKLQAVDAKVEAEKLVADAQKLFNDLVAKGEQRAA